MKHQIDIDTWNRKEHFNFFSSFDTPYYAVTVQVDCTLAYSLAKQLGVSFYSYYLHKTLIAVNTSPNFRYRIEDGQVFDYELIDASSTILRDDHTFGFSHIKYNTDINTFDGLVKTEIARIKNTTGLFTTENFPNQVHFSTLPWLDFSSMSWASSSAFPDSCPKFSIGKMVEENGKKRMAFALNVHHGLIDGYHVGQFFDKLQTLMDGKSF